MKLLKGILLVIAFAGFVVVFVMAMLYGLDKQDRADCMKWQAEAREFYPVYWITPYQKAQCDYWGLEIDAPVKVAKDVQ